MANFWSSLSTLKKRIAIIAGIITAVVTIGKFAWDGFQKIQDYESTMKDVEALKSSHQQSVRTCRELNKRIDSLKTQLELAAVEAHTALLIARPTLEDVIIRDVRFKKAKDGSLYYITDGVLYPATYSKDEDLYYYSNGSKSIWCN
jgi:hypothetical protein